MSGEFTPGQWDPTNSNSNSTAPQDVGADSQDAQTFQADGGGVPNDAESTGGWTPTARQQVRMPVSHPISQSLVSVSDPVSQSRSLVDCLFVL